MPSPGGPGVGPGSLPASPARHLAYSTRTHVRARLHLSGSCSGNPPTPCSNSQLHSPRVVCQQSASEGHTGSMSGRVGEGGIEQHLILTLMFAKSFKSLPLAVPPPRAWDRGPSPPSGTGEGDTTVSRDTATEQGGQHSASLSPRPRPPGPACVLQAHWGGRTWRAASRVVV